jgi:hypothetical protein
MRNDLEIPDDFPRVPADKSKSTYDAYVACDVLVSYYTLRCSGNDNAFLQCEYESTQSVRGPWSAEQLLWVFREVAEILGLRWPNPYH